ncbi:MAG: hypothetical protein ACREPR_26110 [Brasilonema sp.]
MLTVRLDEDTERQLADILAHEKTDKSELIRRLIAERRARVAMDAVGEVKKRSCLGKSRRAMKRLRAF